MAIKTIPLSSLEAHLRDTLNECADSGQPLVVRLPDDRLLSIQSLAAGEEDALVDELIASNPELQKLLVKSRQSARQVFPPRP